MEKLVYILSLAKPPNPPALQIQPALVQQSKNNHFTKPRMVAAETLLPLLANKLSTIDRHVLSRLQQNQGRLTAEHNQTLLKELLSTQRCFWGVEKGPPLRLGNEKPIFFSWQTLEEGLQQVQCRVPGANPIILPLLPLWYVNLSDATCGPLSTDLAPRAALLLATAPPLPAQEAKKFLAHLQHHSLQTHPPPNKTLEFSPTATTASSFAEEISEETDWYSRIEPNFHQDWFKLELGILVDGEPINLLPVLPRLIQQYLKQQNKKSLAELPDATKLTINLPYHRTFQLSIGRIRGILNVLTELYDQELPATQQLRLSKLRISNILELENILGRAKLNWFGDTQIRELGEKLKNFSGLEPITLPPTFNAELRNYQKEGVSWLQFWRKYHLGGILADDMGLGKTIQTLAHVMIEKHEGRLNHPVLVITPTSLIFNWYLEAQRFAPELAVLKLQGNARKKLFSTLHQHDLILTTYPLLVRDHAILLAQEYALIVLDEAQLIKNAKAKATQIVQQLRTQHRLCLTGTPMENHLGELWSLFNFLLPGLLGTQHSFKRLFTLPISKNQDAERQAALQKRIAPFMLRRTKQAVMQELPKKTEIICKVELAEAQRDLYESMRLAMHQKVLASFKALGIKQPNTLILSALLKLRQICCDPRLLKSSQGLAHPAQSAKLELLMDMLPNLIEEGRRILLFSSFTSMLQLIEEAVLQQQIPYVKLTGQTQDRTLPIAAFQNQQVPLFLISLKAGGLGLNLTQADTVIHYDPWWNPAAERQATDRAHRIGQEKAVFVYKLITSGTVEEKILDLQQKKQALLEELFAHPLQSSATLTLADLEYLFQPLMD